MKPVFFIFLSLVHVLFAKNVLIIQSIAARSYSNIFEAIAHILASEHNVTFINRFGLSEAHPNITLVSMGQNLVSVGAMFSDMFQLAIERDDNAYLGVDAILTDTDQYVDGQMNDPAIKYIFQTKSLYDVLILPSTLSHIFMPFAHLLNVPLVQVAASYAMPWQNEAVGNPNYLSTDNSLLLNPNSESFYGRLVKVIRGLIILYRFHFIYLPNINKKSAKYFPSNTPEIEEISRNTSLLLVNTQEPMMMLKPTVSNFVEFGGIHCRPPKDLPPGLDNFMDHTEGVIYMSLGLTVNSTIPQHVMKSILNVFGKLPQRVIFKVGQTVDDVPSNVLIVNSCPQQDILGHRNTRLFITQGGMLSLQEAVFHEVPLIVLPLTLDQPSNAMFVSKLGYGRCLRWSKFSQEAFLREINEVLHNDRYIKRIKEISVLTKDVFKDPKENLKWWINYIIRHKQYPLSKHNRHDYNRSTYHIDIDILLFISFVSASIVVSSLFITIYSLCFTNKCVKIKME